MLVQVLGVPLPIQHTAIGIVVVSLLPVWDTQIKLLALGWSSFCCCSHLESEQFKENLSLSFLSLSFKINQSLKKLLAMLKVDAKKREEICQGFSDSYPSRVEVRQFPTYLHLFSFQIFHTEFTCMCAHMRIQTQ